MPYVPRHPEDRITALQANRNGDAQEELAADDTDLLSFAGSHVRFAEIRSELGDSDLELIRVIEDLVTVLIDNRTIELTDLPLAAQKKLSQRGKLRARLGGLRDMAAETGEVMLR